MPNNSRRDQYGNCQVANEISIPDNCATWYDGCNTCQVRDGRAEICTLMYCFRNNEPYCMSYHIQSNSLNVGDVCYRFVKMDHKILLIEEVIVQKILNVLTPFIFQK